MSLHSCLQPLASELDLWVKGHCSTIASKHGINTTVASSKNLTVVFLTSIFFCEDRLKSLSNILF